MAKVIVERPRRGSRFKHRSKGYLKQRQRTAPDEAPRRERITSLRGGSRWFNEHLSPLRRFLDKQVGRPWDNVFSEICQHIRVDSAVQSHVRDHVGDYVETNVLLIDGQPCSGGPSQVGLPLHKVRWKLFFVCPRTGILRRVKRPKWRATLQEVTRLPIDAKREYRQMEGIWYELRLEPLDGANPAAWDMLLRMRVIDITRAAAVRAYGAPVYASGKRQLKHRAIRRLRYKLPAV